MPEFQMLRGQKVKWLIIEDSLMALMRSNGFCEHAPRSPGETKAMVEMQELTHATERLRKANYFKKILPGVQNLHLHLGAGKDDMGRDCLVVDFYEAKYKPELNTTLRSRTPVPLEVLANYLPSMRLSEHVFDLRGKQTRDFMGKMGLMDDAARNPAVAYVLSAREVVGSNMMTEERFWRDILETCAKLFPRGPVMAPVASVSAEHPPAPAAKAAAPVASQG